MELRMEAKYIGAIVGFILGSVGYTLSRFWIIPIIRFKMVRGRVLRLISRAETALDSGTLRESTIAELRQINIKLSERYNRLHPAYRTFLANKGVMVDDAGKHILTLANTRNEDHARNHISKIRDCL